jgi:ABC-2 type transport system permease protein
VTSSTAISTFALVELFIRLRWRLLRGALRHGGAQRVAVVIGMVAAILVGFSIGLTIAVVAQTVDDPAPVLIVTPAAMVLAIVAIGIIAGVTQPVDPRIIATEPLTDRQLAIGLLTTSACGPPGIGAAFVAVGLYLGSLRGLASVVPVLAALVSFLITLLLVSRSTVNALGLLTNRFPRAGQLVIGLVSLAFYGAFQLLPTAFAGLGDARRRQVADVVRWTPPGQVGEAFATAGDSVAASLGHVALGSLWLPLLAWVFVSTTRRLLTGTRATSSRATGERPSPVARAARRLCGQGPIGAIAWRSVRTRLRHPRTALETFIGAGIGMALVLVPALTRDEVGASAVLVGGAVQLSVLFMAGNSIGSDGVALGAEILCGLEPEVIVEAKARSVLVVASPLVVIGPIIAAAITGEWAFLLAGVLVGVGGLLAGVGGAIVQSTMVPVAVPESDNPLAGGDSGQGLLSALTLAVVLVALAITTLPIALALLWALDRGSVLLVSLLGATTVGAGWVVLRLAIRFAARHWRMREPEIYDAIIPSR